MTQFNSHYQDSHQEKAKVSINVRKDETAETLDQKRSRYLTEDVDSKTGQKVMVNNLAEQKSFRQRLHLFEIISSDAFKRIAEENRVETHEHLQQKFLQTSKDFKQGKSIAEDRSDNLLIQKVLEDFRVNGVGRCADYDFRNSNGIKSLGFNAFCGEMRANQISKLHNAMKEKGYEFELTRTIEDLSRYFDSVEVEINQDMLKRDVLNIRIPDLNQFLEVSQDLKKSGVDLRPVSSKKLVSHELTANR